MPQAIVRRSNSGAGLSVAHNIDEVRDSLTALEKRKLPFVIRDALNDTVFAARRAESNKMRRSFDRPKKYTWNSPRVIKAKVGEHTAALYIEDQSIKGNAPAKYLKVQVEGGKRRAKAFEVRLRRIGVMRPNEFAIPASGYRRDSSGGISGATIVRILSQIEGQAGVQSTLSETSRSRRRNVKQGKARFFVPRGDKSDRGINALPRGIYQRLGKRIKAVFIFVEGAPHYRKRYAFGKAATKTANREFPKRFSYYLDRVRP
ncbi:hypothetical protein [Maritalea sp.]|jgi:hypothetical protein|uniref:hypothetical protein n=1 Tax=Maritalea sp. TaxID=2003361 RepID=UPI0039E54B69